MMEVGRAISSMMKVCGATKGTLRGGGVDHIFCCCFKKLFFASLCSFICLQAVYQLSGPED